MTSKKFSVDQNQTVTRVSQLSWMHFPTGAALALGFAATHFKLQAVSPHAQALAHAWPLAQVASARQASISLLHLSLAQAQRLGHTSSEQSTPLRDSQLSWMHLPTGAALALGFAATHFKLQAVSPHAQALAHAWPLAQV